MNDGERRLCEFQRGFMDQGSFFGLIFRAAAKADSGNRWKLQQAFPEEVNAMFRWMNEDGYAEKLCLEFDGGKP